MSNDLPSVTDLFPDAPSRDESPSVESLFPDRPNQPSYLSDLWSSAGKGAETLVGQKHAISWLNGSDQGSREGLSSHIKDLSAPVSADQQEMNEGRSANRTAAEADWKAGNYGRYTWDTIKGLGDYVTHPRQTSLNIAEATPGLAAMMGAGWVGAQAGAPLGAIAAAPFAAASAPALPLAAAEEAAGTGIGAATGAYLGTAAAMGAQSYGDFITNAVMEEGAKRKIDVSTPEGLAKIEKDQDFMGRLREHAKVFGIESGAAGAAVAMMGGKLLGLGAKFAKSPIVGNAGEALVDDAGKQLSRPLAQQVSAYAAGAAADIGTQAAGFSAANELARSQATGTPYDVPKAAGDVGSNVGMAAAFTAHGALAHRGEKASPPDAGKDDASSGQSDARYEPKFDVGTQTWGVGGPDGSFATDSRFPNINLAQAHADALEKTEAARKSSSGTAAPKADPDTGTYSVAEDNGQGETIKTGLPDAEAAGAEADKINAAQRALPHPDDFLPDGMVSGDGFSYAENSKPSRTIKNAKGQEFRATEDAVAEPTVTPPDDFSQHIDVAVARMQPGQSFNVGDAIAALHGVGLHIAPRDIRPVLAGMVKDGRLLTQDGRQFVVAGREAPSAAAPEIPTAPSVVETTHAAPDTAPPPSGPQQVERDGSGWKVTKDGAVFRGVNGKPFKSEAEARAFAGATDQKEETSLPAAESETQKPGAPTTPITGTRHDPIDIKTADDIALAERQINHDPTDEEKESGVYEKGHAIYKGIPISFENARGSTRSGISPDGTPWKTVLPEAYGYIKRTVGGDESNIDIYMGRHPESDRTFVFDQHDPQTGDFDEHKIVLGAESQEQATAIYDAAFSDGSGPSRRRAVSEMSVDELKDWLKNGDTRAAVAPQVSLRQHLDNAVATMDAGSKFTMGDAVRAMKAAGITVAPADLRPVFEALAKDGRLEKKGDGFTVPSAPQAWTRDTIAQRLAKVLGQAPSEFQWKFADAILNKDGYALSYLAHLSNKGSRQVFSEVTGVSLPKTVGGIWDAVKEWAGITPEMDAARTARAKADRAEQDRNQEFKRVTQAAAAVKFADGHSGKQAVDDWVANGLNRLIVKKKGIIPQTYLVRDDGSGVNVSDTKNKDVVAYARLHHDVTDADGHYVNRHPVTPAAKKTTAVATKPNPALPANIETHPITADKIGSKVGTPKYAAEHGEDQLAIVADGLVGNGHILIDAGVVPAFDRVAKSLRQRDVVKGSATRSVESSRPVEAKPIEWMLWHAVGKDLEEAVGRLPNGELVAVNAQLLDFLRRNNLEVRAAAADGTPFALFRNGTDVGVVMGMRIDPRSIPDLKRQAGISENVGEPPVAPKSLLDETLPQVTVDSFAADVRARLDADKALVDGAAHNNLATFMSFFRKHWSDAALDAFEAKKAEGHDIGTAKDEMSLAHAYDRNSVAADKEARAFWDKYHIPETETFPDFKELGPGQWVKTVTNENGNRRQINIKGNDERGYSVSRSDAFGNGVTGTPSQVEGTALSAKDALSLANRLLDRTAEAVKERRIIGQNADGADIHEDTNGVRSTVTNGVRSTEKVQMTPKGPILDKAHRGDEFKTREELDLEKGIDDFVTGKRDTPPENPPSEKEEDFDAIFNQALDEQFGKEKKEGQEPASDATSPKASRPPRSAPAAGKSAAKNALMGLDEVARGLTELFGGGKTLGSGLAFDEETYAKAKPFFAAGIQHFAEAGHDVADMVRALVKHLATAAGMTREAIVAMRPYIERFVSDARKGLIEDGVGKAHDDKNQEASNEQERSGSDGLGDAGDEKSGGKRLGTAPLPEGKSDTGGLEEESTGDVSAPEGDGDRGAPGANPGGQTAVGGKGIRSGRVGRGRRKGSVDQGVAPDGGGREPEPPPASRANHFIDDPESLIGGTPKVRFARNRQAIETYKAITDEGREPTADEMNAMSAYTGWGSFGQELFNGSWEYSRPKPEWAAEDKWLRQHLSAEEWKSAQSSIINAHYTDPPTVQTIWSALRQMGFVGGRVLEPSMGIGNFFGLMPRDLMGKSDLTGIELDHLSGGMAKMLYPDANIQIKGYQDSRTADGFYDLVVGNWPFAAQSPADRRYDKLRPTLHDYFFLKAIDQTRHGGLVMGVTSNGTMDKAGRAVRLEMAKKADLVAAFRLPSGAFKNYAGTSVVADLLIFRKRTEPNTDAAKASWIDTVDMPTSAGVPIRVNKYWQAHPDAVLGKMGYGHGTTSGRPGMIVERQPDFPERLASLPGSLPAGTYQPIVRKVEPRFVANNTADRENSVVVGKDGKLYQVQGERLVAANDITRALQGKDTKKLEERTEQVTKLVGLRRAYGALIDAERDGLPDVEAKRAALKSAYDDFVANHGPLARSDGLDILDRLDDPAHAALAALERPDGTPAQILTKSTTRARRRIDKPTTSDAYVMARNESVTLDMARVAELAGVPEGDVTRELLDLGAILRIPGGGYEPADLYLAGNVRRKMDEALDAKERGEDMDASIAALQKVMPPDKPYFLINANLGATWVKEPHYRQFLSDLLALKPEDQSNVTLRYVGGQWKVRFEDRGLNYKPEANTAWGTESYKFDKLISAAMNNRTIVIKGKDSDGNEYTDSAKTAEVNEKVQRLREEFSEWAWRDPARRIDLERAFNETMNAVAKPSYDGSFMDMSGMSLQRGDDPFSLRQHQMNAIWRGVMTRRGLYDHEVGTGKTYTIGGLAVESRRYGVAQKPFLFAHNANSQSVAREIQQMYPGAKILYVDNLRPDEMATTLRRIANDDWDLVVFPHSVMDRLGLKRETLERMAAPDIAALEQEAMEEAQEEGGGNLTVDAMNDPDAMKKIRSPTAKALVKQRNAILANIEKMANQGSREGAIPFEDLGGDMIIVDEAHEFKKPPIATRMSLKGLNTQPSGRSIQLKLLTDYVKERNGGIGIHLFTGTPITNTLTELFHAMRYVMDDRLERDGLKDWDAWFNAFAGANNDIELTSTGDYEPVTRLAKFDNVDELVRMAGEFTDVVFAKDMPEFTPRPTTTGKTLESPNLTDKERAELTNGRTEQPIGRPYKKVVTDVGVLSPEQIAIRDYQQQLSREFEAADKKTRREWMLSGDEHSKIIIEGNMNKAAIDARLYNPSAPEYADSKVNRAVANIMRHYNEHPLATQAVFMENGLNPIGPKGYEGPKLHVLGELIDKLVKAGIPRDQIGVMAGGLSSEKKTEMADKMNRGDLRVVIGRTDTMGTGVNMQNNLRAMHHIDAPWTPGELEQRNGRGWRQGNKWNTVLEYRYLTEGLDGRRWQVLAIKNQFIRQILDAFHNDSGNFIGSIEGDAVDAGAGGLQETLSDAAGDPRLILRHKYDADVNKLERRERNYSIGIADAKDQVQRISSRIEYSKRRLEKSRPDSLLAEKARAMKDMDATILGQKVVVGEGETNTQALARALNAAVQGLGSNFKITTLGEYKGFRLDAEWPSGWSEPSYYLVGPSGEGYTTSPSPGGLTAALGRIATLSASRQAHLADDEKSLASMVSASQAVSPHADKLAAAKQRRDALLEDLQNNPNPPPSWLRHGAPVGTEIHVGGEKRIVTGHKVTNDYNLTTDEGPVHYLDAKDENGSAIYDPRPRPGNGADNDGPKNELAHNHNDKNLGDVPTKEADRIQNAVEGKSIHDVADYLRKNATTNPAYKLIAGRVSDALKRMDAMGMKFSFKVTHVGDMVPSILVHARGAAFEYEKDGILNIDVMVHGKDVSGKVGVSERTVLHELVHAATMSAVRLGNLRKYVGSELSKSVDDLYAVSRVIANHFNERVKSKAPLTDFEKQVFNNQNNALRSADEIISWTLTYPEMQAYLETIPYDKNQSLFGKFVEGVRKLLGLPAHAKTALSEILSLSDQLMDAPLNRYVGSHEYPNNAAHHLSDKYINIAEHKDAENDLARTHAAARDEVTKAGERTGHEHLIAVDNDTGKATAIHTTGDEDFVGLPKEVDDSIKNGVGDYTLHHNHPNGTDLSNVDISTLAYPTVNTIVVHAGNETSFARLTPRAISWRDGLGAEEASKRIHGAYNDAMNMITKRLDAIRTLSKKDRLILSSELASRSLAASGLIDMSSTRNIKTIPEHLVKNIIHEVSNVIAKRGVLRGATVENLNVTNEAVDKCTRALRLDETLNGIHRQDEKTRSKLVGGDGINRTGGEGTEQTKKPDSREVVDGRLTRTPRKPRELRQQDDLESAHAAARDEVLKRGRTDGNEHNAFVDADGKKVIETSGERDHAEFSPEMAHRAQDPSERIVIHHNHPDNGGLTAVDLRNLGFSGVHAIAAHEHNGDVGLATLTDAMRNLLGKTDNDIRTAYLGAIIDAARRGAKEILSNNERSVSNEDARVMTREIVNNALSAIGVIDYSATKKTHKIPNGVYNTASIAAVKSAHFELMNVERRIINAWNDKSARNVRTERGAIEIPGKDEKTNAGRERENGDKGSRGEPSFAGEAGKDEVAQSRLASDFPSAADAIAEKNPARNTLHDDMMRALADSHARSTDVPREDRGPGGGHAPAGTANYDDVKKHVTELHEYGRGVLDAIKKSIQMWATPMALGTERSRATAKDFANKSRMAAYNQTMFFDWLTKNFSRTQNENMWNAMDASSVHAQTEIANRAKDYADKGMEDADAWKAARAELPDIKKQIAASKIGHYALPRDQRLIVDAMSDHAQKLWDEAKSEGVVTGEGLPFWTPRMAAMLGEDGKFTAARGMADDSPIALDTMGRNMSTNAPSLKHRKYLTADETETAMMKRFGDNTQLVRDIRTMPIAMGRLERALAARKMINEIKRIGKAVGSEAVSEGDAKPGYFTLDHPALKTFRPKLGEVEVSRDELGDKGKVWYRSDDGKMHYDEDRYIVKDGSVLKLNADDPLDMDKAKVLKSYRVDKEGKIWRTQPALDANGDVIFEKTPLYIANEFEGPLRAVLTTKPGPIYQGLMAIKSAATGLIMYSPLIHNAVEWGRALPTMPGKVATFRIYFDGNKAKKDPAAMREAISAGLTPIGHRFFNQDISSIMEESSLTPGRSWTAKLLGGAASMVNEKLGESVKRGIDTAGDFWHNTLLWDRIADLQMGIYTNVRDEQVAKGMPLKGAQVLAAQMANRYAGALPMEGMGESARRLANVAMFSRSFTIGNLGVMKDIFTGLPRDVIAQLTRDIGAAATGTAVDAAKSRARGAFVMDIALMYAGNAILQNVFDKWKRDKSWGDIEQGYVDRFHAMINEEAENPWNLLNPLFVPNHLVPGYNNEPGKEDRVWSGVNPKTASNEYMRIPTGKIGEEFVNWLSSPLEMMRKKESTILRPVMETFANRDYFGNPVYDQDARGVEGMAKNVGKVVAHIMSGQVPMDSINAAWSLLRGQGDTRLNEMKAFGPLVGLTFSKGYPGGPEEAEKATIDRRYASARRNIIPDVKSAVDGDRIDEARDIMTKAWITAKDQDSLIKRFQKGPHHSSSTSLNNTLAKATPEERARLERAMGR